MQTKAVLLCVLATACVSLPKATDTPTYLVRGSMTLDRSRDCLSNAIRVRGVPSELTRHTTFARFDFLEDGAVKERVEIAQQSSGVALKVYEVVSGWQLAPKIREAVQSCAAPAR